MVEIHGEIKKEKLAERERENKRILCPYTRLLRGLIWQHYKNGVLYRLAHMCSLKHTRAHVRTTSHNARAQQTHNNNNE